MLFSNSKHNRTKTENKSGLIKFGNNYKTIRKFTPEVRLSILKT